ncbi:MAG: lytic transglycosylase domain-containing protein [Thermoanaerobaculia bacterium]|nr:lytic transglycosylase domain-containing protein [Thermoanaerobaculia bacterium]
MTASIRAADVTGGPATLQWRPRITSARTERSARNLCLLFAGLSLAVAAPTAADLVVFTDGHFLQVEGYEVVGERVRLELDNGGLLTVSLRRVDRVIVDEVEEKEPAPEPAPFPIRYADEHGVPDVPFGKLIHDAARRHGINPELVAAVARAESAFRPDAVSVKGAQGLMQLMPATAEWLGVAPQQVLEPWPNLDAGARYLRLLADKFEDDLSLVLAAYNAGEGTVARYGGVPPYRETRSYLKRIFGFLGLEISPETEVAAGR